MSGRELALAVAREAQLLLEDCSKDEEEARDELANQWNQFAREDKTACIRETSADGTPSYVELETCLEMTHLRGRP